MSAYMTPAGGRTRLASENPTGKAVRFNGIRGRASGTHVKTETVFWIGLGLSVMGSITQAVAWLWMLAGGTG